MEFKNKNSIFVLMKKYCYLCDSEKDVKLFYVNKNSKDGRFKVCKECSKTRTTENNRAKVLSRSAELIPLKNETFKKHKTGLLVSNQGRVYMPEGSLPSRVNAARFMKQIKHKIGYLSVSYMHKHYYIHRLVAETFLDQDNKNTYVNHKDLNKLNNNLENLEWTTNLGNLSHAHNLDAYAVKLNRDSVKQIRKSNLKVSDLAKKYGVSQTNIRLVLSRNIWKHI